MPEENDPDKPPIVYDIVAWVHDEKVIRIMRFENAIAFSTSNDNGNAWVVGAEGKHYIWARGQWLRFECTPKVVRVDG